MKKILLILFSVLLVLFCLIIFLGWDTADPNRQISWGVTFSKLYATQSGLDWRQAYSEILDDLKIKKIRLVAYWEEIESQPEIFSFSDLDWQVAQAKARNAQIILALGRKTPRWPECHEPAWSSSQDMALRNQNLLNYIKETVERYKNNSAIFAWQVENEPFLNFGDCPPLDVGLLDSEIALVKSLDSRPIIVTDSGELSLWVWAAKRGDIFGTTMYRLVWQDKVGSYKYPLPPAFFRIKERLTRVFVGLKKRFVVIELQAEPWGPRLAYDLPISQQLELMSYKEFTSLINYAKKTGFSEYYLWGAEWWYWMKQNGHPEYWEYIKDLVASSPSS